MSTFLQQQKHLIKEFVRTLDPWSEQNGTFDKKYKKIMLQLQYHKCLSPDPSSIQREADGLHEKLLIHSQTQKADAFQRLVNTVLHQPSPPPLYGMEEEPENPELRYHVLAFLFFMQNHPLGVSYEPEVNVADQQNTNALEDCEEWHQLLLHDPEVQDLIREDYSDSSDDQAEEADTVEASFGDMKQQISMSRRNEERRIMLPDAYLHEHAPLAHEAVECVEAWLQCQVQPEYWNRCDVTVPVLHCRMHLGRLVCPLTQRRSELSEWQVVREVLLLLQGTPGDEFMFRRYTCASTFSGNRFDVNPGVLRMTHLTPSCVTNVCVWFTHLATVLLHMRLLVRLASTPSTQSHLQQQSIGIVYCTLAHSVAPLIACFERVVIHQEDYIRGRGHHPPPTLLSLQSDLRGWYHLFATLSHIIRISCNDRVENIVIPVNGSADIQLLNELHHTVEVHLRAYDPPTVLCGLFVRVFLQCLLPYVHMLDAALSHHEESAAQEANLLFIVRDNDANYTHSDFWSRHFVSHPAGVGVPNMLDFLRCDLALGIKSVHLMKCMGEAHGMLELLRCLKETTRVSFVKHISALIPCEDLLSVDHMDKLAFGVAESCFGNNHSPGGDDPEFAQLVVDLQQQMKQQHLTVLRPAHLGKVEGSDLHSPWAHSKVWPQSLTDFTLHLQSQLSQLMSQRLHQVNSVLVETLWKHFHLAQELEAVHAVFLCGSGLGLYDFFYRLARIHLQDALLEGEDSSDVDAGYRHGGAASITSGELTSMLHASLLCLAESADFLSEQRVARFSFMPVLTPPEAASRRRPGEGRPEVLLFHRHRLSYHLHSPVHFLITPSHMELYQELFTLLAHVKSAKMHLERLLPMRHAPDSFLFHRVCILRLRLLHCVSSMLQYLVYHVMQRHRDVFYREVRQCEDFDALLHCHHQLVHTLHREAFLDSTFQILHESMLRLLGLASGVPFLWGQCLQLLTHGQHGMKSAKKLCETSLQKIENDFRDYSKFLFDVLFSVLHHADSENLTALIMAFDVSYLEAEM